MIPFNSKSEADDATIPENPYLPPSTVFEPRETTPVPKAMLWLRVSAVLQIMTICVGAAFAFVQIKSIIYSGVAVSILGLITLALALRFRSSGETLLTVIFAASGPAFSLFVFLLIVVQDWGPSDARRPVAQLVLLYGLVAVPLGLVAVWRSPRQSEANPRDSAADLSSAASATTTDAETWI